MEDAQPPFLDIQFVKNKGQITDKLICYFCKKILRSPIKQCPICQRLACKLCLEQQPNDGYYCLFSRDCQLEFGIDIPHQKQLQQYRDILIENNDPLQDWILLYNLDQLEIQCPYSFNPIPEECCQKLNLRHKEFINHSMNCRYKQIKCENYQCQDTYVRQNKLNHLKICQFVKIECIWCNDEDYKIYINNHQDSCIYRKKCKRCQLFFSTKKLQEHDQECLYLQIICSGCSQYMIRKEFNEHKSVCTEIQIECKCGESIKRKKYDQHTQNQCMMKTIKNIFSQLKNFNISIDEKVKQLKEKTQDFSIQQYIFNSQIEQEEQTDIRESWVFDIHQKMSKYGYVSRNSSFEERNSSDKEDTFIID